MRETATAPYNPGMPRTPTVDAIMLEQRAASFTRRSIKNEAKLAGLRLALSMLDLTTLEGSGLTGEGPIALPQGHSTLRRPH